MTLCDYNELQSTFEYIRPGMLLRLGVDFVLPHFLFGSRRVVADPQDGSHLLDADEEDLSGDVESNTLGAGRRRQASPEEWQKLLASG